MTNTRQPIYLGTDSGATTSKTGGVWADGSPVCHDLRQSATNASAGREAVVSGWLEGAEGFLADNGLVWDQVHGVGLAIPGPYKSYGILERTANLPPSFEGWNFYADYSEALTRKAGRPIPLVVGNDGNYGGVAEAALVRGHSKAGVLMLAPGSGLGGAYVDPSGFALEGDTLAGMEVGHMAAPLHLLDMPPLRCGCGRTWGCIEPYTTISGLPQLMEIFLPRHPGHPFHSSSEDPKKKALALRGMAQEGDPLALEIFDFQAKALGLEMAVLVTALDPEYVVIGGGLVDPGSTTAEFRSRYLNRIREAAEPYLFPAQKPRLKVVAASLGELSQAIGAALVALYTESKRAH